MINLDGRDLSLAVMENTSGLYRCEALIGNWGVASGGATGFLYFDRRVLDFGKTLQVRLGSDPASLIFDGRIMALEASFPTGEAPTMRVLAEDRLQDLRMTRRSRTFIDMSDAEIMTQIAQEHGLTPQVNVAGPAHKIVAQVNQSDLAFLRERARAVDVELWASGKTLHARTRSARPQDTLRLSYQNELEEFTVLADLAGQRSKVTVSGWDVAGKEAITAEATAALLDGELKGDLSGASILADTIGQRQEVLAHTVPLTSREAQAQAEAYFKLSARRFVIGRGVAQPDARLRVGNRVELLRLGPMFSGPYYVTEVRHRFDLRGLQTEFTAERAGLGRG